jgi:hypothetical protein
VIASPTPCYPRQGPRSRFRRSGFGGIHTGRLPSLERNLPLATPGLDVRRCFRTARGRGRAHPKFGVYCDRDGSMTCVTSPLLPDRPIAASPPADPRESRHRDGDRKEAARRTRSWRHRHRSLTPPLRTASGLMLAPYIFYRMNAATLIFKEPVGPTDPKGVKGFDRDDRGQAKVSQGEFSLRFVTLIDKPPSLASPIGDEIFGERNRCLAQKWVNLGESLENATLHFLTTL